MESIEGGSEADRDEAAEQRDRARSDRQGLWHRRRAREPIGPYVPRAQLQRPRRRYLGFQDKNHARNRQGQVARYSSQTPSLLKYLGKQNPNLLYT